MTTIVTRAGKGSPLTHTEVDTNFTNLNTNKFETAAIPLGTAAAPSISFLSDANTGIYSPGADQVAVATNGTQRLLINSGGITSANGGVFSGDVTSYGVQGLALTFNSNNSEIRACRSGGNYSSLLFFTPGANSSGVQAERVRITSEGLVGIGTSSPIEALTVNGRVQSQWNVFVNGGTTSYSGDATSLVTGSTTGMWAARSDSALLFSIGSNEKVRIDSSGRVGIGNTTSGFTNNLIIGSGTGDNGATIYAGTAGSSILHFADGSSGADRYRGGIVYNHANNSFNFATNDTSAVTIDSSQRLLVGTSTADSTYILSGGGLTPAVQFNSANVGLSVNRTDDGAVVFLSNSNNISTADREYGRISFNGSNGSGNLLSGAWIQAFADAATGTTDMPGRLVFSTTADGASSPTERMRITSAGRFNNVSTEAGIFSETTQAAGTSFVVFQGRYSATAGSPLSGTTSFQVYSNGNVQNTNNSYGAISDIKLKENIVDANSQWDDLKALQVRNYNFKEGQTHTQIGLVAQEVELVSPGLVSESPDRDPEGNDLGTVTKSVNYSVLYMKAVKALQEAMERIEALEADVAQLKGA